MTQTADSVRRLKAIMFTDIKGYSAMMGVDEARTVQLVLEHRQIVREVLQRHDGQEHETIGDAFVVLFDSVVNAVRCGAEIQSRLKQRNEGLKPEDQVWLRIGIHLGDIIVQGDGIYGDGVNLAARVESKADPGGICITEQVFLQIDGKVDLAAEPIGRTDLKNIRNPPKLYRLRLDGSRAVGNRRPLVLGVAVALAVLGLGGVLALGRDPEPAQVPVAAAAPTPVAAPVPAPIPAPAPAPVPDPAPAPAAVTATAEPAPSAAPQVAPTAAPVQDAPAATPKARPAQRAEAGAEPRSTHGSKPKAPSAPGPSRDERLIRPKIVED